MNDNVRQTPAELKQAPHTADMPGWMSALVSDVSTRIATEALRQLPFDSSPYAYQVWLAAADRR